MPEEEMLPDPEVISVCFSVTVPENVEEPEPLNLFATIVVAVPLVLIKLSVNVTPLSATYGVAILDGSSFEPQT